jgi:hypothetical protein
VSANATDWRTRAESSLASTAAEVAGECVGCKSYQRSVPDWKAATPMTKRVGASATPEDAQIRPSTWFALQILPFGAGACRCLPGRFRLDTAEVAGSSPALSMAVVIGDSVGGVARVATLCPAWGEDSRRHQALRRLRVNQGPPVRPRPRLFDLRRHPEQQVLATVGRNELDPDREPVLGVVQRE